MGPSASRWNDTNKQRSFTFRTAPFNAPRPRRARPCAAAAVLSFLRAGRGCLRVNWTCWHVPAPSLGGRHVRVTPAPVARVHDPSGVATHGVFHVPESEEGWALSFLRPRVERRRQRSRRVLIRSRISHALSQRHDAWPAAA
jgi:hypothetical protein